MMALVSLICMVIFFAVPYFSFGTSFLAGLSPTDYVSGEQLNIYGSSLRSPSVKVAYGYDSIPLCLSDDDRTNSNEKNEYSSIDIGRLLTGERLRPTAYQFRMLKSRKCEIACGGWWDDGEVYRLMDRIKEGYYVGMMVDSMPAVQKYYLRDRRGKYKANGYRLGWKLGFLKNRRVYVHNHIILQIFYHRPDIMEKSFGSRVGDGPSDVYRVVGFYVKTLSIDHQFYQKGKKSVAPFIQPVCPSDRHQTSIKPLRVIRDGRGMNITFTYDVVFKESKVKWTTRWDPLMKVSRGRQHAQWISVVNSFLLTLFLTMMLGVIMLRTVRRDFKRYGIGTNPQSYTSIALDVADTFDDGLTQSGWKMLRRDVFREPPAGELLAIFCGSGVQIVVIALFTLMFALLGVINPRRRGDLVTALVALFTLSSGIAGYVAARFHKSIGGRRWRLVSFGVAIVPPAIAGFVFFVINLFLWIKGSITVAPFLTMFVLMSVWLGLSIPLAFIGTLFGYKRKAYDFPVRSSSLSRQIPPQPIFLTPPYVHLTVGLLPFGIVWIELRIMLHSIWQNELYYMFGFLFLVFILVLIMCAECSIVLSYIKLCNEDYHWWWDAFWASATSGLYVFTYSCYFLIATPGVDASHFVSSFLFLAYAALFSVAFAVGCGSIGLLSALWFVRRLYSRIQD